MENTTLQEKLAKNLVEGYKEKMLSDNDLVQLIELIFDLLNLKTYSQAVKESGKSYNGIKKCHKKKVNINGIKLIIDNE